MAHAGAVSTRYELADNTLASRPDARARNRFAMILCGFAVYAGLVIYRSSFSIEGVRYFCLVDDAMISMRYAANFAHHYGLVWNPGSPPVEGYTNPLWVLMMAGFHLLPISPPKMSLCVQIAGAVFLLLNLVFVRKIARQFAFGSETVALSAVALTAFYFPLDNWGLRGSEVAVLALAVTSATWIGLGLLKTTTSVIPISVLLGISTLVRPDMAVFAVALLALIAMLGPGSERFRRLATGLMIIGVFIGAQALFGLYYYGSPLPNTYYLKLTGYPLAPRLSRGVLVAAVFAAELAPVLLIVAYSRSLHRLRPVTRMLLAIIAAQFAYSIWVGGDAWEWWGGSNRYISIVMPLVMVLVAYSLKMWLRLRRRRSYFENPGGNGSGRRRVRMGLATALLVLAANAPQLGKLLLITAPPETTDNSIIVREALMVRRLTTPSARIALVWAGAEPYFSDRPGVDLLGMNDPVIAHERMHIKDGVARWVSFWPGHLKWNYDYSIGVLQPDVILQFWKASPDSIESVRRDYIPVSIGPFVWYVRRETPNIHWDKIPQGRHTHSHEHQFASQH